MSPVRIYLPLALLLLASAPAAQAATQPYVVTSFDSIRVEAPVNVIVTTGGGISAKGEGDREALDRLELQNSGSLLVVRMRPAADGGLRGAAGVATLRLSTGQMRRATLSGGGTITVNGMKGQQGELALNGGGDITINGAALDRLNVALWGSGRVTLSGKAGRASILASGPGAVRGEGLTATRAELLNNGPGSIAVTVTGAADVNARGSGDVTVLGKPVCKVAQSGTGRVLCGGSAR